MYILHHVVIQSENHVTWPTGRPISLRGRRGQMTGIIIRWSLEPKQMGNASKSRPVRRRLRGSFRKSFQSRQKEIYIIIIIIISLEMRQVMLRYSTKLTFSIIIFPAPIRCVWCCEPHDNLSIRFPLKVPLKEAGQHIRELPAHLLPERAGI